MSTVAKNNCYVVTLTDNASYPTSFSAISVGSICGIQLVATSNQFQVDLRLKFIQ